MSDHGQHEKMDAAEPVAGVFTKAWVIGAADRALKSFASTLILLLGGGTTGLDVLHVDWRGALGTAAGTLILSILFSIASVPLGDQGTTSLLPGGK